MDKTHMFLLQLQVPIIAGDIVEATNKAKDMLTVLDEKGRPLTYVPYSFFQVMPVAPEVKK